MRREPLSVRRGELEGFLGKTCGTRDRIFISVLLAANGLKAFDIARKKGYEGLVAKDTSAAYVEGRSNKWLKVKVHQEDEFVIVGYTEPAGARKHFGALLLGAYDHGKLRYVGKVGTGFDQESLARLYQMFQPLVRMKTAVVDPPREKDVTYLAPRLVAEIAYEELTADRKLRQPVFLGLRDDKSAKDVTTAGGEMNFEKLLSHPDKVFWPEEGYTKLDLARFYEAVFPKMKPYIADRMLSLERCPDGMSGQCFYQKASAEGTAGGHADQADQA